MIWGKLKAWMVVQLCINHSEAKYKVTSTCTGAASWCFSVAVQPWGMRCVSSCQFPSFWVIILLASYFWDIRWTSTRVSLSCFLMATGMQSPLCSHKWTVSHPLPWADVPVKNDSVKSKSLCAAHAPCSPFSYSEARVHCFPLEGFLFVSQHAPASPLCSGTRGEILQVTISRNVWKINHTNIQWKGKKTLPGLRL